MPYFDIIFLSDIISSIGFKISDADKIVVREGQYMATE